MEETVLRQEERSTLTSHIDSFPDARILVIGDIILDEYLWGDVSRISPEAPVPVVEVTRETTMCGGAANVVSNLASLGAEPILCGVVGDDRTGEELLGQIARMGLVTDGIVVEPGRPTSIKTRVVARSQQVVRFDRERRTAIDDESVRRILECVSARMPALDGVIVSDYGKGVVSEPLMKGLRHEIDAAGRNTVMVAVDPKTGNFEHYRGVDVITPNHHEAGAFCGFEIVDEETLLRAGRGMLETLRCRSVLITQGRDGMTLFESGGEVIHIPTVAKKVFDVTGAGDTVISVFCLGAASGLDLRSSAVLSNIAAGIVVGEVGTSVVDAETLKEAINRS